MPFGLFTGLGAALAWVLFAMLASGGMSLPSDRRAIVVSAAVPTPGG
jgi:hypothetical protein